MKKKIIAITMGDAAGIGPEIIVKALGDSTVYDICSPLVIGDSGVINKTLKSLKSSLSLHQVDSTTDVGGQFGVIDILDLQNLQSDVIPGKVSAECGRAAMEYISKAAEITGSGDASAMATAPINKESVAKAGYSDTGHMKYLARITGTTLYAAMLMTGTLKVVHLSDHYSLREACDLVKRDLILAKLKLIRDSFVKWNLDNPRIGVAALNPHGSDGGLFGTQEETDILPAINDAKLQGINASGPFPADSIFNKAINGEFDVILAMYHDQGHIAVKVHGFETSVAVTLGLPFVRTSVDHGTALDIAGKGIADHRSMIEAITTAVELS